MPFKTRNYLLEAFLRNEPYSASADQRRFTTIDNQLAFITDRIGSGRINGWQVVLEDEDNLQFSISRGIGIIGRSVTRTFNDIDFNLTGRGTFFVYVRRKPNVLGGFGDWSKLTDQSTVVYDDGAASSLITPSNLKLDSVDRNSFMISWDKNTVNPDLSHYNIYRSNDGVNFSKIDESESNEYTDLGLEENKRYFYRVSSVDLSNNESGLANSVAAFTQKDLSVPLPPKGFVGLPGHEFVQLAWRQQASSNIDHYNLTIRNLDNNDSGSRIETIDPERNFIFIDGLENDSRYRFSITSVSHNGVESSSVSTTSTPIFGSDSKDVSSVDVTYKEGRNSEIIMTLDWDVDVDPYDPETDHYSIQFVENGDVVSNQITSTSLSKEVKTIPFSTENGTDNRTLRENTLYHIRVRSVDINGNEGIGVIFSTRTPSFTPPGSIDELNVSRRFNGAVVATWLNSYSNFFDHNVIKITKQDDENSPEVLWLEETDIGVANNYVVPLSDIENNIIYNFYIYTVDEFGNTSNVVNESLSTEPPEDLGRPNVPSAQDVTSRGRAIHVTWNADADEISFYKIYRTEFATSPQPEDFSVLETVPSDIGEYADYEVDVGTRYIYFVTSVDRFGNESLNPVDDNFISHQFLIASPRTTNNIGSTENVNVSQSGHDAVVSWSVTSGAFDGYEIWRSEGGKYNFDLVGHTSASENQFLDKDALLRDGEKYYYVVRKFLNEAGSLITSSATSPDSAIQIAEINVRDDGVEIIDRASDIKFLRDNVRESTREEISNHDHTLNIDGSDKRIDLSSNIVVNGWSTNDYKIFTTNENISGASAYIITLDGEINEEFFNNSIDFSQSDLEELRQGNSPFLFEINPDRQELVFEIPLYDPSSDSFSSSPFSSEPSVTLEMIGINEVQGSLPRFKVDTISASKVEFGEFDKTQLPDLHHEGRINEPLVPLQHSTFTDDEITYFLESEGEEEVAIDNSLTFYDVNKIRPFVRDDKDLSDWTSLEKAAEEGYALVAASSQGVLVSDDFGGSWRNINFSAFAAPTKIFYSENFEQYFALSNSGVFSSSGDLGVWTEDPGVGSAKIIRDIDEDSHGVVYVTTDLGVYNLEVNQTRRNPRWQQSSLSNPRSAGAYAIYDDKHNNRIIFSSEIGLLESYNQGRTWSFTNEFTELKPIFDFEEHRGFLFAITNDSLWRKKISNTNERFTEISRFDAEKARKIKIFNNRVFVTTSIGILSSSNDVDIINSSVFELGQDIPQMNINDNIVPATSLNVVDELMFVGTDQRLFSLDESNSVALQFENIQGDSPTVFKNESFQNLGFHYYNGGGSNGTVSFDTRQSPNDTISIAIDYSAYKTINRGWVFQKYNAELSIYNNRKLLHRITPTYNPSENEEENSSIEKEGEIVFDINDYALPVVRPTTSYIELAEEYRSEALDIISQAQNVFSTDDGEDSVQGNQEEESQEGQEEQEEVDHDQIIEDVFHSTENFLSQLYPSARVIQTSDGSTRRVDLPSLFVNIDNLSVDVTQGIFRFNESFGKYDTLAVDILDVTFSDIEGSQSHEDLEDSMEIVNSGLHSSFSQALQSNIIKSGVFAKTNFNVDDDFIEPGHQYNYMLFDRSSEYDYFNSTIDFNARFSIDKPVFVLPYVATSIEIENTNEVVIGGFGGLLGIDKDTKNIREISIPESRPIVKKITSDGYTIYLLSSIGVYYSEDNMESWEKLDNFGLPNDLFSLEIINNTFVLGAEDGIYYKTNNMDTWQKSISSERPVETIQGFDLILAIVDDNIVVSANGKDFSVSGGVQSLQINNLQKFKGMIFVGSNMGLYKDHGTSYSKGISLSLVDVSGSVDVSQEHVVNDLSSDADTLWAGLSDGSIVKTDGEDHKLFGDFPIDAIHSINVVKDNIWIFSYNSLIIIDKSRNCNTEDCLILGPMLLSSGAPINKFF